MLGSTGFDLWADGYDASVGLSDEENTYPFAGYKKALGEIYGILRDKQARSVLDVGCGTGVLGAKLCAAGLDVTGIDFSDKMLKIARERMPEARLIRWDFAKGLPEDVKAGKYDAVVCTYAMHHLPDDQKGMLLREMTKCVHSGGLILVGDIAFETAADREDCRASAAGWDEDEFYMAMDEMNDYMVGSAYSYYQVSMCAGVLVTVV
ncbi:MAG: class I SAM-dependent methyltransferase [Clostridia bacterium]|nr:class I SAM-dependent methyltransferase [Clostridia bacterium]